MSLRTHCTAVPGKGMKFLYKLVQYLRLEGEESPFSAVVPEQPSGYVLRFSSRANGHYSCPSNELTDFPAECKDFFKWKLKHIRKSCHGALEGNTVKDRFLLVTMSRETSVKLSSIPAKKLESQQDQQEINLSNESRWRHCTLFPWLWTKYWAQLEQLPLRQPLEIQAAGGIHIYRYSCPSITVASICNDLHPNSYFCGTLFPALFST